MSKKDMRPENLHTLSLEELRELAMEDCSQYTFRDECIAWELFDRLVEGGRITDRE